jgi:hypothetical protein
MPKVEIKGGKGNQAYIQEHKECQKNQKLQVHISTYLH